MTITKVGDEIVVIVRVYEGNKWVKVIREDGSIDWVRAADIAEEEI